MTKLAVKQFIHGKRSGAERPDYEIVAKSQNINHSEIEEVFEIFSRSQLLSTEIPNHDGSWLISPVGNQQVALLRRERSLEKEIGRQHFLYEHYKIFNKSDLKQLHRLWLFALIGYEQRVFSSLTSIDDQVDIDDDFLLKIFSSTLADLFALNAEGVGDLALKHLHTLLKQRKLRVQGNVNDIHRMIAALSLILPSSQSNSYKVFIGKDLPSSWDWDVAFMINSDWGNTNNPPPMEQILSNQINNSYTKIIYKILGSNKDDWHDFPERLDKINLDTILNQDDLERALGNAVFRDFGLQLINFDIRLKRANAEDVHIAWKELVDIANSKDIKLILPTILEGDTSWDQQDYDALKKSLSKHDKIVFDCLSDLNKNKPEKFLAFLLSWLNKHPSQKELSFIENLLFELRYQKTSILLNVIEKREDLAFRLVALLFNHKGLSNDEALLLVNIVLRRIKTRGEVTDIISKMARNINNQLLHQIINYLISTLNNLDAFSLTKGHELEEQLNKLSKDSVDVFFSNLVGFAVKLQLQNLLSSVLLKPLSDYGFTPLITSNTLDEFEKWGINARSKIISASYVMLLQKMNNLKKAMVYMTLILLRDINEYKSIAELLYGFKNYIPVSTDMLTDLKLQDRVLIFSLHMTATQHLSLDEKSYFRNLLNNVSYSPAIIKQLDAIYPLLIKNGDIETCKIILELQIRDAILTKNDLRFDEKISFLDNLHHSRKRILRSRIISDYLRNLSHSLNKQDFINKMLLKPLAYINNPKLIGRAFATSLIFKSNYREILADINCRIEIYRWVYKEYRHHHNKS